MLLKWNAPREKHALPSSVLPPKTKVSERFVKAIGHGLEYPLSLISFVLKRWQIKRLLYINEEDAPLSLSSLQECMYKQCFMQ